MHIYLLLVNAKLLFETKFKTRKNVYQATIRTGKAIEAQGCTCEVACLPGPQKGVDDFVVAHQSPAPDGRQAPQKEGKKQLIPDIRGGKNTWSESSCRINFAN